MTTIVLGVAGAAAGFAIGGPFGASIGWSLGVMAGGYLDPQKIQGPRLTDLRLQGSSYGAYEPTVYGVVRLSGNVIWQTDLRETEHTSGGKGGGGGTKTTTYSYSASFDVAICETQVYQFQKVWAYGRLIYDSTGSNVVTSDIPVTFYDGNASQVPDPTEEADTGVGLTPAYRHLSRAVFNDWDLSQFSNMIPALEFQVSTLSQTGQTIRLVKERRYSPNWQDFKVIGAWSTDLGDDTPLTEPSSVADSPQIFDISCGNPGPNGTYAYQWWRCGGLICADGDAISLWLNASVEYRDDRGEWPAMCSTEPRVVGTGAGGRIVGQPFHPSGMPMAVGLNCYNMVFSADHKTLYLMVRDPRISTDSAVTRWYKITAANAISPIVIDTGTIDPQLPETFFGHGEFCDAGDPVAMISGWAGGVAVAESNGRYIWSYNGVSSGTIIHNDDVWNGVTPSGIYLSEINPSTKNLSVISIGAPIPGYGTRGAIFGFRDGYVGTIGYDDHYFGHDFNQTAIWTRFGLQGQITLAEVVADQCDRAGMSAGQYDVTQLVDIVDGYIISNQMAARSAIEALMPVYFFDAVESDGKIKFVKRGAESVATIPDDDLAAHEDGSGLPALLSYTRKQEVDLPAAITIVYPNLNADYQLGSQVTQRMVTSSQLETTVQTAVVLDDVHAKQIVDTWLYNAWVERDTYTFQTTRKYSYLEPTDVVEVRGLTLRITAKTESESGVIKWTALASHGLVFAQISAGGSGRGQTPPTVTGPQRTVLQLLDIPYIADPAQQAVYWAAMQGEDRPSWMGASLQKSLDGGTSYTEAATATIADVMGVTATALGNFAGGNVFDELNQVSVVLGIGSPSGLASATETAILNGANEAVLGAEILQFRTASLTATRTYTLSGLLRGRRGTEWAMGAHVVGERFVLLPAHTQISSVSAEYYMSLPFKAVTAGRAITTAPAQSFRDTGVTMLPYCPVQLGCGVGASGSYLLQWRRRARVNNSWQSYVDVPLGEANEQYEVTFWSDAACTVEVGSTIVTTTSLELTTALQTTIYGSPLGAPPFWTVAQIGSLGPGFDSLGRAPAIAAPPPPPPTGNGPGAPINVPPIGPQWHSDFRFLNGGSPLTHAMKNANWLMVNFGSSWSFCYVVQASRQGLHSDLQTEFIAQYSDLAEANRIINTFAGAGYYAPPGVMVPWGSRLLPPEAPWMITPSDPPALLAYAGQTQTPTIIPLPYFDDTAT